jgi:hypothetical protein
MMPMHQYLLVLKEEYIKYGKYIRFESGNNFPCRH